MKFMKAVLRRFRVLAYKVWAFLVEGRGVRTTAKKLWSGLWKEVDRALGIVTREILKKTTPVVKNKVFFHTQENRYACNPKYICEEMLRRGVDADIVWRVSDKNTSGVPAGVKTVIEGSFEYFKEILSANVVVTNSILAKDQYIFLNKKQTLIETWHGSLGIKRFGKNDYKSSLRWVIGAIMTGKMTDYCITNSSFVSSSLRNTYWEKTPMLEYGHPRNDLFFDTNRERREALREQLCRRWNVDPDTKFVMYGPTFRDNQTFDCYNVDFDRLTTALSNRFGGKWCVLLRYHPSLMFKYKQMNIELPYTNCKVLNVTDYLDMQELIAVADAAITDYSSWIYDFMLLRKPGFIFATDIKRYNNERGFCYPLETTPFPIATNNDRLEKNVLEFDEEQYLQKLEAFLKDKGCIEDGHASERTVDLIERLIGENKQ